MTCKERITDLVEAARRNAAGDRELRAHLAVCADCRERWDAERQLTAQLGIIRAGTMAMSSPDRLARRESRESLLRDFSRTHRRPAVPSWVWALAAAAALLLAVFLGHAAGKRTRPAVRTQRNPGRAHEATVLY